MSTAPLLTATERFPLTLWSSVMMGFWGADRFVEQGVVAGLVKLLVCVVCLPILPIVYLVDVLSLVAHRDFFIAPSGGQRVWRAYIGHRAGALVVSLVVASLMAWGLLTSWGRVSLASVG